MYILILLDLPKLVSFTIINAALYGNPENKEQAGNDTSFFRNEITIESITTIPTNNSISPSSFSLSSL